MAELLVGVDIGTQGVKAALYTVQGQCLATAFLPSRLHRPNALTVEEDPEFQLASVCQTIRKCLNKAKVGEDSVAAVACDGQMAGVIGVGVDGLNVTPYDSWLDQRCTEQIGQMEKKAGELVLARTGCSPSFNHGPKILRWKKEYPNIYKEIEAFVQPAGYVAMRLCGLTGREAFIDKTYLHFSGFANNSRSCWDEELCKIFGVAQTRLPHIVNPHQVVGQLTGAMARRCGLKAGVPVVAGCGDTAASFLSCGATREGICVDVAGTASVFAATTGSFKADLAHKTLACGQAATAGLWHPYAYINGGGMNLEWFRTQIANRGKLNPSAVTFKHLNKLAMTIVPAQDSPFFIPHLGGRVCPTQPSLRGAWVDLHWNHTLGHLYRAVLEGVALEYALYADILGNLYPNLPIKEIRITGGGEKSAVWNGIKADVIGTRVVQIDCCGGAPMGAALLAGYGVGLFKNLASTANAWISKGQIYRPNRKQRSYYQTRMQRYKHLLAALDE